MEIGRWQQELKESIQGLEEDLSEIRAKMSASILQYFCLENPMDRGAWQVTAYGVPRVGHDLATKTPPPASCTDCVMFFTQCSSTSFHYGKDVSQLSLIFLCNKTSFSQFFNVASRSRIPCSDSPGISPSLISGSLAIAFFFSFAYIQEILDPDNCGV